MMIICPICEKRAREYRSMFPDISVCSRDCEAAEIARCYLERMSANRHRDREHNKMAYEQAEELAAWLSVYRFGIKKYRKRAAAVLNSFASQDRITQKRYIKQFQEKGENHAE